MVLVKVANIQPGMVLAANVRDLNERLLLSKGVVIEDQHLRILKMWGIFEVKVEAAEGRMGEDDPSLDEEQVRTVSQVMASRFSRLDLSHPAIIEILRLSIAYRVRNGIEGRVTPHQKQNQPTVAIDYLKIGKKIDRIDIQLPEVPSLVFELNEIIADPLSAAKDIAKVVNQSPSLTATLLRIVNSAYYGFRSKIDSISRAIMLIGSNEVSNLALGVTIMETFRDIPMQILDVASFLEHSLACGTVARLLAAHAKLAQTEQIFVSGMLHDIGRLILCKYFPEIAKNLIENAVSTHRPLAVVERELIRTTHTQLGKKLLQKWKLPFTLENNIYYHHNPSASPQPQQAAMVMLADIIVHGLGVGNSGEHMVPSFDAQVWDDLKLSPAVFKPVVQQAMEQLETLRRVMEKR